MPLIVPVGASNTSINPLIVLQDMGGEGEERERGGQKGGENDYGGKEKAKAVSLSLPKTHLENVAPF
jgi:hypothetical protein